MFIQSKETEEWKEYSEEELWAEYRQGNLRSGNNKVYIFKLKAGPDKSNVYDGMIKVSSIVPGKSVDFSYRRGNRYAHLLKF